MKIFITGATGYIGHAIAIEAARRNISVVAFVRSASSPHIPVHENIKIETGDLIDRGSIIRAMHGCTHVIHSAGITRLFDRDPDKFYTVNVDGTRNVLEAALVNKVSRFVFTSSCAVLGPSYKFPVKEDDPRITTFENHYEISKYAAEQMVQEYAARGIHAVVVAPSRVYGPGIQTDGNPITAFVERTVNRGFAFIPNASEVLGNYVYIDDVVNGHLLAMEMGKSGEKYIVGGENCSYETFFTTLQSASEKNIHFIKVGKTFLQTVALFNMVSSFLFGRLSQLSPKVVTRLFQNRAVDSTKAIVELGYKTTSLKQGLHNLVNHLNTIHENTTKICAHYRGSKRIGKVAER